jgi:hypothetical protein
MFSACKHFFGKNLSFGLEMAAARRRYEKVIRI